MHLDPKPFYYTCIKISLMVQKHTTKCFDDDGAFEAENEGLCGESNTVRAAASYHVRFHIQAVRGDLELQ